jgi:hypothetical protein
MSVSAPPDHVSSRIGLPRRSVAIPPGHRPTCPQARVDTAIPIPARATGSDGTNGTPEMVTQDRIFDRHELPGGRVTRDESR